MRSNSSITAFSITLPCIAKFAVHVLPLLLSFQMILFSSLLTGYSFANQDKGKKEVSKYQIKINRLQHGISSQESLISKTKEEERNILVELETLDKKIARQQSDLDELEIKMLKQQGFIEKKENELEHNHSQKNIVENHLKKRISAYYVMGDIGLLNVTFSTKTLPELLKFHDAFDTLIQYDQDVIRRYGTSIEELERTRNGLNLEQSVLQDFIDIAVQKAEMLKSTKDEKNTLLTHVRTQTKLHQQAIREMMQASEELSKSIVAIKNKNQALEQTFLTNKEKMVPPVDGILITLFEQEKTNKLGISRKSNGIELKAPDGTNVIAVESGEVIYSGYLRGYGNTCIIHHGFQYYTVTSRIENILITKGKTVKAGDVIGVTGDTATLFDEGLYFEVRHGNQSLDPLLWLNPNLISTSNDNASKQPN